MKKFHNKFLISLLIAFCVISSLSLCIPVRAESELGTSEAVRSSVNTTFTFYHTCTLSYGVSGYFMNVQVVGFSSNTNAPVTLEIFINNLNVTITRTFYTNAQYYNYNNIFLGFSGGSAVAFRFTAADPLLQVSVNLQFTS